MPNFFLSYKRAEVAGRMPTCVENGRVAPDLRQARRDTAKGPPDSATKLPPGINRAEKTLGASGRYRSDGDEAVHNMGRVGRAGSGGHGRGRASSGATRSRQFGLYRRVRRRWS